MVSLTAGSNLLWDRDDAPVHQGLNVCGVTTGEGNVESRDLRDIRVVDLVEATSFDYGH